MAPYLGKAAALGIAVLAIAGQAVPVAEEGVDLVERSNEARADDWFAPEAVERRDGGADDNKQYGGGRGGYGGTKGSDDNKYGGGRGGYNGGASRGGYNGGNKGSDDNKYGGGNKYDWKPDYNKADKYHQDSKGNYWQDRKGGYYYKYGNDYYPGKGWKDDNGGKKNDYDYEHRGERYQWRKDYNQADKYYKDGDYWQDRKGSYYYKYKEAYYPGKGRGGNGYDHSRGPVYVWRWDYNHGDKYYKDHDGEYWQDKKGKYYYKYKEVYYPGKRYGYKAASYEKPAVTKHYEAPPRNPGGDENNKGLDHWWDWEDGDGRGDGYKWYRVNNGWAQDGCWRYDGHNWKYEDDKVKEKKGKQCWLI